ncbi:MAG: ACT domain-containing protein [Planctomycetota bacterium]|nr:MAG: ACT domain-containing protein [Planctomycetota bacterium]
MELIVERVDVWAASIKDEVGGLSRVLMGLREAGADLDFVIARRAPEKPGTGVVFVTPLRGDREIAAAADLGFNVTNSVHSVRIEGANKAGVTAELTDKLAKEGINLRGLSASVSGARFVIFMGLDNAKDAAKAVNILERA